MSPKRSFVCEVEIQDKRLRETKVLEKEISKSYIG